MSAIENAKVSRGFTAYYLDDYVIVKFDLLPSYFNSVTNYYSDLMIV